MRKLVTLDYFLCAAMTFWYPKRSTALVGDYSRLGMGYLQLQWPLLWNGLRLYLEPRVIAVGDCVSGVSRSVAFLSLSDRY